MSSRYARFVRCRMVYLTLDDMLSIRDRISVAFQDHFEVMSSHGLMSALASPQRSAFGKEVFPTLIDKAGALVYSLVQNHPFWDGNKRIASAALRLFIQRNGAELAATERDLKQFTIEIARGTLRDDAITSWIANRIEYT